MPPGPPPIMPGRVRGLGLGLGLGLGFLCTVRVLVHGVDPNPNPNPRSSPNHLTTCTISAAARSTWVRVSG